MAQRQQRKINAIPLPVFGLNDVDELTRVNQNFATTMENIDVSVDAAETRKGSSLYGSATGSGPILSMVDYRKSDGSSKHIRQRRGNLEWYNSGTWTDITLPVTLSTTLKLRYTTLNDVLSFGNGTDNEQTYDGTTVTERASKPKGVYRMLYQNREVLLKGSRVYFSAINDPTTYGASDYIDIDPNNAATGKGLGELNGQIIVFKENKKYVVTALVGGSVYPLDGSVSAVSCDSIVQTDDSLIFLSYDGWYELRGTTTRQISKLIDISRLDASRLLNSTATYYMNKYRCAVTEDGEGANNLEYVFHTDIPTGNPDHPYAVTVNRGMYINCYVATTRSGQVSLYYGDSRADSGSPATTYAKTYQMFDGFSDNGVAIDAFWTSKFFDAGVPFYEKRYKDIHTRLKYISGVVAYLAYRFTEIAPWSETSISISGTALEWTMDDLGTIDTWLEGLDWPIEEITDSFSPIASSGRPRMIQFRNRASSDAVQTRWLSQAYRFRPRQKFR